MKQFKDCPIDKDVVILASGEFLNEIPVDHLNQIAKNHFVIAVNFVNRIKPDMRIWSDKNVTDYLDDKEKDSIWVTRRSAFHPKNTYDILNKIDYWFDDKEEKFDNNYKWTLYWLLQLLRKYFKKKRIYVFGMDCQNNEMTRFVDGKIIKKKDKKNNCENMPVAFQTKKNMEPDFWNGVYNMNLASKVTCLEYRDYHELIDG